jgi:hypothetical protein
VKAWQRSQHETQERRGVDRRGRRIPPARPLSDAGLRARHAYTLFELILVLAMVVVITAFVFPSVDAMYGNFRLTAAADTVRGAWAAARAHAMDEGRAYRFAVVPNMGNYRLAPDSADFWAGNGEPPTLAESSTPPLVIEDALPKGVRFTTPDVLGGGLEANNDTILPAGTIDPGQWARTVTFLPDGTAREDVEIVFHARGVRPAILRLRALTGAVTLKSFAAEVHR